MYKQKMIFAFLAVAFILMFAFVGLPFNNLNISVVEAQYGTIVPAAPEVVECYTNAVLQVRGLGGKPYFANPELSGTPLGIIPTNNGQQKYMACLGTLPNDPVIQIAYGNNLVWVANTGNVVGRWLSDNQ